MVTLAPKTRDDEQALSWAQFQVMSRKLLGEQTTSAFHS
jgi:hypothetical protein